MSFQISMETIPGSITEFKGHSAKMGDPALVIQSPFWAVDNFAIRRAPCGEDPKVEYVQKFTIGGVEIQVGETTVKGSSVQSDGTAL